MSTSVSPKKVIVLVGGSQNGKSTFVRGLGGDAVVADRDSVFSTTVECESFTFLDGALTIVDTPGTGDAQQDDDDDDDGGGGGGGGGANRSLTDLEIRRKVLSHLVKEKTNVSAFVWCTGERMMSSHSKRTAIFLRDLINGKWENVIVFCRPCDDSNTRPARAAAESIKDAIKNAKKPPGVDWKAEVVSALSRVRFCHGESNVEHVFRIIDTEPVTFTMKGLVPMPGSVQIIKFGGPGPAANAMARWAADLTANLEPVNVCDYVRQCRRCLVVDDCRLFDASCHAENVPGHLRIKAERRHHPAAKLIRGHGDVYEVDGWLRFKTFVETSVLAAAMTLLILPDPDLAIAVEARRLCGAEKYKPSCFKNGPCPVSTGCVGRWEISSYEVCCNAAVLFAQDGQPDPPRSDSASCHELVWACQTPICTRSIDNRPFESESAAEQSFGIAVEGCRRFCRGTPGKSKDHGAPHDLHDDDGKLVANREKSVGPGCDLELHDFGPA